MEYTVAHVAEVELVQQVAVEEPEIAVAAGPVAVELKPEVEMVLSLAVELLAGTEAELRVLVLLAGIVAVELPEQQVQAEESAELEAEVQQDEVETVAAVLAAA